MTARFATGYCDEAIDDLPSIVAEAKRVLTTEAGVDFDTLVGTGFSGAMVIPMLATELGVKFVLVRKEHDDSHHGGGRLVGNLGARWIFVDDFISGGNTRRRVVNKIGEAIMSAWDGPHETSYVGDYLYAQHVTNRFRPFDPEEWR